MHTLAEDLSLVYSESLLKLHLVTSSSLERVTIRIRFDLSGCENLY